MTIEIDPVLPSLAEVRADYIREHTRNFDAYQVGRTLTSEQEFYGEKFDRAIAAHDVDVRKAALEEAYEVVSKIDSENAWRTDTDRHASGVVDAMAAIRAAALGDAPTGGSKRALLTEPHDGHADTETCPGCPHAPTGGE